MAKPENTNNLREDVRDWFDQISKSANYLLVANATGLIACLAVLKDYSPTGIYKGIGVFIFLFAIGLMAAIFGYVSLQSCRYKNMKEAANGVEPTLSKMTFIPLSASMICFLMAVSIIVFRTSKF